MQPAERSMGEGLDAFLARGPLDDAVSMAKRIGAGVLLLHEQTLLASKGDDDTLSLPVEGRPGIGARGFRVFPLLPREDGGVFLSVGRTPTNDVVIPDANLSRFHAFFRVDGETVAIQDAGSKFGSFVNGDPVPRRGEGDPVPLKAGDTVRFGPIAFTFLSPVQFQEFTRRLPGTKF